jgi:hypothetical protein
MNRTTTQLREEPAGVLLAAELDADVVRASVTASGVLQAAWDDFIFRVASRRDMMMMAMTMPLNVVLSSIVRAMP